MFSLESHHTYRGSKETRETSEEILKKEKVLNGKKILERKVSYENALVKKDKRESGEKTNSRIVLCNYLPK